MKVGVTGHQHLVKEDAWIWVENAIRTVLAEIPRMLVGVSSLAGGTDQVFAQIVLDLGGCLYGVIPFPEYERTFRSSRDRQSYLRYVETARWKETLEPCETDEEAFLAAGKRVVALAETMVAVWDGKPARGPGGAADVVGLARAKGITVIHIDPISRWINHI